MLTGRVEGAKAEAAESNNCLASDSLRMGFNQENTLLEAKSQDFQFDFEQKYLRVIAARVLKW